MTETRQGHQEKATLVDQRDGAARAQQRLIDRYLSNRLSGAELELVETRIIGDTDFRDEVELTEALRDGLRQLNSQGEVAPLLAPRSRFWALSSFGLAASIIAGLLGVTSLLLYERLDQTRQALTSATAELTVTTLTHATTAETLRFEHTRSGNVAPDVSWHHSSTPTLLELRFDVGLEPAASYRVLVERVATGADTTILIAVPAAIDGAVSIAVHSAILRPGDYRIRLEPQSSTSTLQEPISYTLRVAG